MTCDARIRNVGTLHDSQNERRPAVVVRRRVADDLAHRRPIVVLEPPAERVGQKLFGDRARETARAARAAARAAPTAPRPSRRSPWCRWHRRACPLRRSVRHPPITSKFSSANPSGSITEWQLLHVGFCRCCASRSRIDRRRGARLGLRQIGVHAGRRRRHGQAEDVVQQPFAAQHRRRAVRDTTSSPAARPAPAARRADRDSGASTRRKRLP